MYILSRLADKDIEKILEQSIINFGTQQTEIYFESLKKCLELLGNNPAMGIVADDINLNYHQAMDIKNQFD